MTSLYALVLIIYMQPAYSLDVRVTRIDIVGTPQVGLEACNNSGQLLIGPIMAETNSVTQYTWQDFKCVSLEKM